MRAREHQPAPEQHAATNHPARVAPEPGDPRRGWLAHSGPPDRHLSVTVKLASAAALATITPASVVNLTPSATVNSSGANCCIRSPIAFTAGTSRSTAASKDSLAR